MSMKKRILGYVAVATAGIMIGCGATVASTSTMAQAEDSTTTTTVVTSPFTEAVAKVHDSVVGVSNYQTVRYSNGFGSNYGNGFGFGYGYGYGYGNDNDSGTQEQEVLSSTGSGVVVADGYVLTNYHVVEDAVSLKVTTEDESYDATLVAYDENLDVAVMYVPDLNLTPVTLGDSDTLQVGDWAICIGNPLSDTFAGTVTAGIVSGLNRSVSSESTDKYGKKETTSNTMIQIDAAINNGNSGGGMFNTNGELMGIPTLKYSGTAYSGADIDGIGMCIPINAAKPVIEEALAVDVSNIQASSSSNTNSDLVGKPRMGITTRSMNASSQAVTSGLLPNGCYVVEVEEGTPAANAGIQAGDIIVDVDDTVITSVSQLQSIIASKNAGDVLNVKVYRVEGGQTEDTDLNNIGEGSYIDVQVELAVVDDVKQ